MLPDHLQSYHKHQRLSEYSSNHERTRTQRGQQCGVQMTAGKRVVGGDDAQFGELQSETTSVDCNNSR